MTIGEKIKKARQLRGWTQAQLASIMNLPISRIQQYEANIRTPKLNQLEEFTKALGVNIEYLTNHHIDSYDDVKHVLLELEDTFGLKVSETNGSCVLQFSDAQLSEFLAEWLQAKKNSIQSTQTIKEYEIWKATYPNQELDRMANLLHEKRNELRKK